MKQKYEKIRKEIENNYMDYMNIPYDTDIDVFKELLKIGIGIVTGTAAIYAIYIALYMIAVFF